MKVKPHILFSTVLFQGQTGHGDNIMWRMRIACRMTIAIIQAHPQDM